MTRIAGLPLILLLAALLSCSSSHLIDDNSLRKSIVKDYRARSAILGNTRSDLFGMADTISDRELRDAIIFILAYIPLSDLGVCEPGYLTDNALAALRARHEMEWGESIPVSIFLNFVLPTRVNNENPDNFRTACYAELKERVDGLDAMEAALEINRWCHEKVAYQAADSRTSSPLATMLSARGRCGEESVFAVSALRAVSIPARQVYTPRWAHTDDNHAWVEFWVDGSWHYLGACEPEPVTDRGWFTEPARRAMLVHTKAFGKYDGNEKIIRQETLFTEINSLDRYAETRELKVRVTDNDGAPVPGAAAGYMLYNYAEFYPLARLTCNSQGECSLTTGYGTLLVWADDGLRYGFCLAAPEDTTVTIAIASEPVLKTEEYDLQVPPVPEPFPALDPEMVRMNSLLLKRGDSIRTAYISTWMADVSAEGLARETGLPAEEVSKILTASMGNYRAVTDFLRGAGEKAGLALRILKTISDKDLRDTSAEVLADHLVHAPLAVQETDSLLYDRYVLSPRVANELLSPFRSVFYALPADLIGSFRADPVVAAGWTDTEITLTDSENYYAVPLVPGTVLRLRMADSHSRNIFFVALCRSAGRAARLEPGTGRPQYYKNCEWHNVWFSGEAKPSGTPGYVRFIAGNANPGAVEPEYHVHFSLARIEQGRFRTLDYGYGVKLSDLPDRIALDPGTYMLTIGNRDDNGNVLSTISFHELNPGEELPLAINPRDLPSGKLTGLMLSLEAQVHSYSGDKISLSALAEKGLVLMWIEPGREPTRHLLNDLPGLRESFDEWGGWFVLFTDPGVTPPEFRPEAIEGKPANTVLATDPGLKILRSLSGGTGQEKPLPVVILCNSDGEVLYSSEGYRIGTGQQMLKKILE